MGFMTGKPKAQENLSPADWINVVALSADALSFAAGMVKRCVQCEPVDIRSAMSQVQVLKENAEEEKMKIMWDAVGYFLLTLLDVRLEYDILKK